MGSDALVVDVARLLRGGSPQAESVVALPVEDLAAFPVGEGDQAAGDHMMERYVARNVSDAELAAWLRGIQGESGIKLDPEQREAVRIGVQENFGLVTGGAGVGKTTVLRALCDASDAFGRAVHLMALTGRAAVRMREAAGRPASTIAAFLRRAEASEVVLGPESRLVIDEASMLDLPTFYRILRHVPAEARILLVSDPGQLPPIGFGLVLHALVADARIPKVELVRVYRQTDATGIPAVGRAVRAGTLPPRPSEVERGGLGVVMAPKPGGVRTEDVVDIVADLGGFGQDLRILSATKAGPAGIDALNARFHAIMAAGLPETNGFAEGQPVRFLKNDYRRDLRNGSLGVVRAVGEGTIVVDFDGVEHEFAGASFDDLTLAYAIIIHKAQGSQFRTVVIPVAQSPLLDRSLLYTAVTRAVDLAVLLGPVDVLSMTVARQQAADRRDVALTNHLAAARLENSRDLHASCTSAEKLE